MCISDPPPRPAEPADTEARTLARIYSELDGFWRAGGRMAAETALERIGHILADAGYAAPGPEGARTEHFLRLWSQEDERGG